MADHERSHPKISAKLYMMMGVSYDATDTGRIEMMKGMPIVGFAPER